MRAKMTVEKSPITVWGMRGKMKGEKYFDIFSIS